MFVGSRSPPHTCHYHVADDGDTQRQMASEILKDFVKKLAVLISREGVGPMHYGADDHTLWCRIGRKSFTNLKANASNYLFGPPR